MQFSEQQFIKKEKKLSDIIKKICCPHLMKKSTTPR